MVKVRDKINFHNIIIYAVFVFAFSGLLLLLHSVFVSAGSYWIVFPQFAPVLTVVFLLAIKGRKRVGFDLTYSFIINKRVLLYSICAALFVVIVFWGFGFFLSAFGKPFSLWEIPLLEWQTPSLTVSFLCVLLGCIGEEIGWRGYLLPALNRDHSLIVSSLLIGVLWGAWHLDFGDGVLGFFVTILFFIPLSIIISWFQTKSGGSVIPAIVLHFFVNFFARSTLLDMSLTAHFILSLLLIIIAIVLFFADRKTFASKECA